MNPYLTFASLLALGQRGIRQQLALPGPPVGPRTDRRALERLPRSLDRAVERMLAEGSRAREVLGRETVEHLGATRVRAGAFAPPRSRPPCTASVALLPPLVTDLSHAAQHTDCPSPRPPPRRRSTLSSLAYPPLARPQQNEWELFSQAVTDWEMRRYLELA